MLQAYDAFTAHSDIYNELETGWLVSKSINKENHD